MGRRQSLKPVDSSAPKAKEVLPRPKKKKEVETPDSIICCRCGDKNPADFYLSNDPDKAYYHRLCYCKNCMLDFYQRYYAKYNDTNLAIYYTCRKIDVAYIHAVYQAALSTTMSREIKNGDRTLIKIYMQCFFVSKRESGETFDDSKGVTEIPNLSETDVCTEVKRARRVSDSDPSEDKYDTIVYDTAYLQNKWGEYTNEDLALLESEYLDWQDKLGGSIDTKDIDIIVKQICYQSIDINKTRLNGGDVTKKMPVLVSLMNNAGLIDKQKSVANQESIGQRIEDIERHRPIKTTDPELSDVDKLNPLITAFIGATARALGKENDFTEKFKEYYSDYSVDIVDEPKVAEDGQE